MCISSHSVLIEKSIYYKELSYLLIFSTHFSLLGVNTSKSSSNPLILIRNRHTKHIYNTCISFTYLILQCVLGRIQFDRI